MRRTRISLLCSCVCLGVSGAPRGHHVVQCPVRGPGAAQYRGALAAAARRMVFLWLVETAGGGEEVLAGRVGEIRDFLAVFSPAALHSLLVVLCGGEPGQVEGVRRSLEDLTVEVGGRGDPLQVGEGPQHYQSSLGFSVLHYPATAQVGQLLHHRHQDHSPGPSPPNSPPPGGHLPGHPGSPAGCPALPPSHGPPSPGGGGGNGGGGGGAGGGAGGGGGGSPRARQVERG